MDSKISGEYLETKYDFQRELRDRDARYQFIILLQKLKLKTKPRFEDYKKSSNFDLESSLSWNGTRGRKIEKEGSVEQKKGKSLLTYPPRDDAEKREWEKFVDIST